MAKPRQKSKGKIRKCFKKAINILGKESYPTEPVPEYFGGVYAERSEVLSKSTDEGPHPGKIVTCLPVDPPKEGRQDSVFCT